MSFGSGITNDLASNAQGSIAGAVSDIQDFLIGRAFPNIRFFLEIDNNEIGSFSSCSGLNIEVETLSYVEGGVNNKVHQLPTRIKYSPITLKRGINFGTELYDWFKDSLDTGYQKRKNVTINIYGHIPYLKLRSITLSNAYPTKYTGADLSTDNGSTAVESIEFTFESLLFKDQGRLAKFYSQATDTIGLVP